MRVLRRVGKIFLWLVGAGLALAVIAFLALWRMSPGTAQPILGDDGTPVPGAISTIETVTLGGVEQYLIIRGHDATAPVMLYVHGGPGSPEYPMLRQTNPGLERDFVMVYWEQRGAGKSFDPDNPPSDMSVDRFVADTGELARWLRGRFGKEKVFLMGHSWGSLVGLLAAREYPGLFHHYFGISQIAEPIRGEQMGLDWARAQAEALGDADAQAELAALSVPAMNADFHIWMSYLKSQRGWLDKLGGGLTHRPTGFATLTRWVMTTPEYTISDKSGYLQGMNATLKATWSEFVGFNLTRDPGPINIPVTLLHGSWDHETPLPLARELYEALDAPDKLFVEFEHSAHSPIMEEPERFNAVVRARAGLE